MKTFTTIKLYTDEQNVSIEPNEMQTGIVLEIRETDDKGLNGRLYLSKQEAEVLIYHIRSMLQYLGL